MNYSTTLVDSIGNIHERKNSYLLELAEADTKRRKELKRKKSSHSYIIKLKDFRVKEKEFLKKLKRDAKSAGYGKDQKALKIRLFKAEKKKEFYTDFTDISYDALLETEIAALEIKQIPDIFNFYEELNKSLADAKETYNNLDEDERSVVQKTIKLYSNERKEKLTAEIKDLAEKCKSKIISKKAYKAECKIKKKACDEDILAMSFSDPKISLKEKIENIEYKLKTEIKTRIQVLEADISDIRRKTPIETEPKPLLAFLTFLLPGLGQLLNKQYAKAFFFFLISIFIYVIALPYILGLTNYQGSGIAGLINLAEGGTKIDKSIIFMIEGIISLILILFSCFLCILSFKDVRKVERNAVKGMRSNVWFETKQKIGGEGFPYLASTPALIVIIFIVLVPILTTVFVSFTNMDPVHQNKFSWTGFQNYLTIITGSGVAGKAFYLILGWTLLWTLGASTLSIAIGFILALIVNQDRIKGKGVFRTIYLLPWAVPAFITIMFFSLMVSRGGPITELISKLFGVSVDIKNNPRLTRIALILLQGWLGSAYIFLLSTGVLQGIPKDLYEAAQIDGATGFQQAFKITVPLVLYQTAPLLIMQYAFNFNNFSIIYLFNLGGPFEPTKYGNLAGSSDILISYIYKLTIENQYQAIGAAITMVISLVLMLVEFLNLRKTKAFQEW